MKKGQQFEAVIETVDFPNKGKLHMEDREVTIKGAIKGQKVKFQIQKLRKGRATGRLLEVIEPSPLEGAVPACPHFGACGGCFYQTVSYENQLKIKESQIRELLDSVCSGYRWDGIKGSPDQWGYRNKMEFSFGDEFKDGPLALGMHKKGGFYDIVTVSGCKIVNEDYTKILNCVLEYCTDQGFSFYHKMSHEGFLRHLVVRRSISTSEILVNLVTSSQEVHDFTPLVDKILHLSLNGELSGFLHTINDSLSDVVKSDETRILYGRDYFYEHILGLKFKISPFSFFQTNSKGAEVLYETARSYIGDTKDKVIFDLYSGTGTIAQMLAPIAKKVVGVEIVEEAVEAAKENAALNGLDNCQFIAGDVLKVVDELKDKPDFIVLDPPRDGIHPKAIGKIIDFGVKEMVYISCKPTSLVRDLEVLQAAGYRVVKACAVDMFPGTVHVETVVLMSRVEK
ncbi:MAG: 23S rRNA (uracil(1939)-C(5))-methyltransferase RlmD [Lachnospiraceae bacterium]|nr:23S rRNA (uracil(1939)-C(5))-methyltransferase RlmD [Lachnospiraceae bacterium]